MQVIRVAIAVFTLCFGMLANGGELTEINEIVEADGMLTIRPKELTDPVINPGKGWVGFGHVEGKSAEELAIVSIGYRRFDWSLVQPTQDGFDWQPLDEYIASWAEHGKKVAFGIMAANTHSKAPDGYVTPKWVFDAGVPVSKVTIRGTKNTPKGRPGTYYHPKNFNDEAFLGYVDQLIAGLAERYDGHPNIAFIDVRTFQNWGEGHGAKHVAIHEKYFKKTRLCQSVHGGNAPKRAKSLAERGIAVRRDGIGGSKGKEVAPAAGLAPAIFEFWGSLSYLQSRGWWREGDLVDEAIEIGKPTYVEFIRGSAEGLLGPYRHVVDRVTNRIGFHFILKEIQIPQVITPAQSFTVTSTWYNAGVSRIFAPCVARLGLLDEQGQVVAQADMLGSDAATWLPAVDTNEESQVSFAGPVPAGKYTVAIGLFESTTEGSQPVYRLGIDVPMVNDWHALGPVTVQ